MDHAKISSIPEIAANHVDAEIVHEAAIGKINSDQLVKLQTFGLSVEEAEKVIVDGFLKQDSSFFIDDIGGTCIFT